MENSNIISDAELNELITKGSAPQLPILAPVPPEAEARGSHRWLVFDLRANLYWQGREYLVKVCDVSLTGLALEITPKVLQAKTQVILVVDLEEFGTMATPVEIVSVSNGSYKQQVGVHFRPCVPDDLLPLQAYIDNLAQRASPAT